MANRSNVYIVQRDNGWGAQREGAQCTTQVFETKAQAIRAGRQIAREGKWQLLIHGQDGRIRARDSNGSDPCQPRDRK